MVSRHLPLLQRSYTFLPSSLLMTAWHIPTPFTGYGNNINFKANLLSAAHKNTLGYFEQASHFKIPITKYAWLCQKASSTRLILLFRAAPWAFPLPDARYGRTCAINRFRDK